MGKLRFVEGGFRGGVLVEKEDEDEDEEGIEGIVYTYGKGKESKAQQDSYITDKRKDPHVVMATCL